MISFGQTFTRVKISYSENSIPGGSESVAELLDESLALSVLLDKGE